MTNEETLPGLKLSPEYPPNIDAIRAAFQLTGNEIFAYGDTIHIPSGVKLSDPLIAHEVVHLVQQAEDGPEKWWERYIADPKFRFEQELEAHRVEYQAACMALSDRNRRKRYLHQIAVRLASKMYGRMITYREASKAIRGTQ